MRSIDKAELCSRYGTTIAVGVQDLLAEVTVARQATYGLNDFPPWRRQTVDVCLGNGFQRGCPVQ